MKYVLRILVPDLREQMVTIPDQESFKKNQIIVYVLLI